MMTPDSLQSSHSAIPSPPVAGVAVQAHPVHIEPQQNVESCLPVVRHYGGHLYDTAGSTVPPFMVSTLRAYGPDMSGPGLTYIAITLAAITVGMDALRCYMAVSEERQSRRAAEEGFDTPPAHAQPLPEAAPARDAGAVTEPAAQAADPAEPPAPLDRTCLPDDCGRQTRLALVAMKPACTIGATVASFALQSVTTPPQVFGLVACGTALLCAGGLIRGAAAADEAGTLYASPHRPAGGTVREPEHEAPMSGEDTLPTDTITPQPSVAGLAELHRSFEGFTSFEGHALFSQP